MAYYVAAKQNHPDIRRDDPHAKEKFQEVADAYELLSDPIKRRLYDMTGQRSGASAGGSSTSGASSSSGGFNGYNQYSHVDAEELFRKVQEDVDVIKQAFSDYIEEISSEISYATTAASRGEWSEVWEVVKSHKGLVFGVLVPSLVLLRFPALIAVVLRGGLFVSNLVFVALLRSGNVTTASRLLWQRMVALSRERNIRKRRR